MGLFIYRMDGKKTIVLTASHFRYSARYSMVVTYMSVCDILNCVVANDLE